MKRRACIALGTTLAVPLLRAQAPVIPARKVPEVVEAPWPRAAPASLGLDSATLEAIGPRLAREHPRVKAVTCIRDAQLVAEYQRTGLAADDLHNIASVTKCVTATLVGIALRQGLLRSLDAKAQDLLPASMLPAADPRFAQVTVAHLLTMSSGLRRDNRFGLARAGGILQQRLFADPGTRWAYDSAPQHLLSVILTRLTGQPAARWAERVLFAPLGIGRYNWFGDDDGYSYGSHDLFLAAADMARVGQLYLDEGMWRGQRLLDAQFARDAVRGHIETGEPAAPAYGYAWRQMAPVRGAAAYVATGFGGQYVLVVPSQRLVVAAQSDDDYAGPGAGFLREAVLPAVWVG